jgi:hypothetical protein
MMTRRIDRRSFLSMTGLAATSGDRSDARMHADQHCNSGPAPRPARRPAGTPPAATRGVVLDPVEVSGEEAVPIIGRLLGARRMYVLPADAGSTT